MKNNFFNKKKILITGHTGFKGSWLTCWLSLLGAQIYGISLKDKKESFLKNIKYKNIKKEYFFNIQNFNKLKKTINDVKPNIIFHLAAQPLVNESYHDPINTWKTNLIGSLNVLESVKNFKKQCVVIMITSDKCYKNFEKKNGYHEEDILGGSEPYSASKAAAEILIKSHYESFFKNHKIKLATCRAGNVIGGGDWSKNRIIPDCIKSWFKNKKLVLKNPNSTRPWQHVLEPLSGYMLLCKKLYFKNKLNGESFNFGPKKNKNYSVLDIVKILSKLHNNSKWKVNLNKNKIKETKNLSLISNKAVSILNWKQSVLNINETLNYTYQWYSDFFRNKDISKTTREQITNYYKKIQNF